VDDFLTSLPNKNILLITHAGVIKALHHLVEGVSIEAAAELSVDYGEMLQLNIQCSPR
jgi:alpha-ribazole phosphatase